MINIQIQADPEDNALDLVRSAIAAEVNRLELGIRTTERHIHVFEDRYQVSSDIFLREYSAEDLADGDQEYVVWAGELNLRDRIASQLKTLKGIQYAA
ncbi:MAG: hypothetical protein FIA89_05915 [Geobacter sp.]|nr:hypothetical protein [Geobacter sp.]